MSEFNEAKDRLRELVGGEDAEETVDRDREEAEEKGERDEA